MDICCLGIFPLCVLLIVFALWDTRPAHGEPESGLHGCLLLLLVAVIVALAFIAGASLGGR